MPFCEKRDTFVIVVLQCHELLTNGVYRSLAHLPVHREADDLLEDGQQPHDDIPEFGKEVGAWCIEMSTLSLGWLGRRRPSAFHFGMECPFPFTMGWYVCVYPHPW